MDKLEGQTESGPRTGLEAQTESAPRTGLKTPSRLFSTGLEGQSAPRTLIFFSTQQADEGLVYFLRKALLPEKNGSAFLIFSGSHDSLYKKVCTEIDSYKDYDYFIFIEPGLTGPFLPGWYQEKRSWVEILLLQLEKARQAGYPLLLALPSYSSSNVLVMRRKFCSKLVKKGLLNEKKEFGPYAYLPRTAFAHPYETLFALNGPSLDYYRLWHDSSPAVRSGKSQSLGKKSLVLYTFHSFDENVAFFLRQIGTGSEVLTLATGSEVPTLPTRYIFIPRSNSPCPAQLEGKEIFEYPCKTPQEAWRAALLEMEGLDWEDYDYFFFLNSSLRGPFLPFYNESTWTEIFLSLFEGPVGLVTSSLKAKKGKWVTNRNFFVLHKRALFQAICQGFLLPSFSSDSFAQILSPLSLSLRSCQSALIHRDLLLHPRPLGEENDLNADYREESYLGQPICPYEQIFVKYNCANRQFEEKVLAYTAKSQ